MAKLEVEHSSKEMDYFGKFDIVLPKIVQTCVT